MADEVVVAPEVPAAPPAAPPVTPTWRDTLPDDLKADASLASFKDVAGLAKSYVETKKMVGAKVEGMVKVPGDNATPDEVLAFNRARGVPASPTDYQVKRPQIAQVIGWDENAERGFLAAAHKAGFTPGQVQEAINFFGAMEQARHDANKALEDAAGLQLRREWGANYDANLGLANRFISQYGGDGLVEFLHTSKLGANPMLVKALAAAGADLMEHGAIRGDDVARVAPEAADAKVRELQTELEKLDPSSPRAVALVDEIYKYAAAKRRGGG